MDRSIKEIDTSLIGFDRIPSHWQIVKNKHLFRERLEYTTTGTETLLSVSKHYGVKPTSDLADDEKYATLKPALSLVGYKIVNKNDLVMNIMRARNGSYGISQNDGIVSSAYCVYQVTQPCNVMYLHYFLRTPDVRSVFEAYSTGIAEHRRRLYSDSFLRLYTILPPRDEQDQIVRYLDWKVSSINRLIDAKRRQIALLQEKKQSIINKAFLRSIDGWISRPLKYWVSSNKQSLSSNINPNYEFQYIDISSVGQGFVKQNPKTYCFSEAPSRARRIVQHGDTIISNVRTYLRSVCYIDHDIEHCIVSTGFSVLTPNKYLVLPELLSYALSSNSFINEVIKNSIGVSYPAINDSKLSCLKVSLPQSIVEQKTLYETIKVHLDLTDMLLLKIRQQIETIIEYRTRLISDVVTGKMDVRDIFVPQHKTDVECAISEEEYISEEIDYLEEEIC